MSMCGSCSQKVSSEEFAALAKGQEITLPCGHENVFDKLFIPLRPEWKTCRTPQEVKRQTWHLIIPEETLTVGPDQGSALVTAYSEAGAWDQVRFEGWNDALWHHEIKVHRFMDFHPNLFQSAHADFDTVEYEGIRFVSKLYDAGSVGVTVKASHMRLMHSSPVTTASMPSESALA